MKSILNINSLKHLNNSSKRSNLAWFLFLTTLFLIFNSSLINSKKSESEANNKSKTSSSTSSSSESLLSTSGPLRDYFYIQRFYPGNDVLDALKESEYSNTKKYLEINDEVIFFAKSLETKSEIEDSLNISEIYDPQYDDFSKAKCCSRVSYEEFPLTTSLTNIIPAMKNTENSGKSKLKSFLEIDRRVCTAAKVKGPMVKVTKPKDLPITRINPVTVPSPSKKEEKKIKESVSVPNLCILIHVPDEAKWRICSERKTLINRLYMKIVYSVLKKQSKNNQKVLEKIIENPKILTPPTIGEWNWDHQGKWSGKCKSNFMQSPINITKRNIKTVDTRFNLSMHLTEVHTLIKKNFGEIIVVFLNFGGVLKIAVDSTYLMFTPQYMSFRFPGETIIDGNRSMGDIQIHFAEVNSKTGTAVTNGLILNIPLKPNNKKTSLEEFDNLNLEFWRSEVMKNGVYTPKKYLNKKLMRFSLDSLSKRIVNMSPTYMVHMGSETIPPCKENIIHISLDTPLELPGCQFKLLRENSLISSRPKEIHTRTEVPANDRSVYTFNNKALDYIPSIEGIVPQSFNKYLLTNGATYRAKRRARLLAAATAKTKKVVRIGKNGKPVIVKIKAKPNVFTKAYYTKKNKARRGGFGPGFSKGKNRIFTKTGAVRPSAVARGAVASSAISSGGVGDSVSNAVGATGDNLNCEVKN